MNQTKEKEGSKINAFGIIGSYNHYTTLVKVSAFIIENLNHLDDLSTDTMIFRKTNSN
jgi:hypothetical protein